jgi:vancomycin resistance protein YoaR
MKKHFSPANSSLSALLFAFGAVLLFLFGAYGLTRLASRGEVMGRVEVADTPIGGLDEERALTALIVVEDDYTSRPAVFNLDGKFVSLEPPEAGLSIDRDAMVAEALGLGRQGNVFSQFAWWFGHIFDTVELPVRGSIDGEAIGAVFDTWDADVIGLPADPGGVEIVDGEATASYPKVGTGVDRPAAAAVVEAALLAKEPERVTLPTVTIVPTLTDADVDAAVAEATTMLDGPIKLSHNGTDAVFSRDDLLEAFRSDTTPTDGGQIVNYFDTDVVDGMLDAIRDQVEDEPVDARFDISGDTISIVPGANGTQIDAGETAMRLAEVGLTEARVGQLPLVEGAEPNVTTAELEALNIHHLVSQFTTYHDCCADRVTNIHTIADTVDGAIVMPGETFSLNDFVGQRTLEKGYLPAGTIIAGELEDTVGGGVSQFTTTLYNAVFWGGYEDIEHKPHSYYFSRYPEGIEATLNWRTPDLKFRNDTDGAILIDTLYTDTSITVRIFGDNDGRTLKGEQSNGSDKIWVDKTGGPDALHVKASVSDRYAITEPPKPKYVANPDLDPEETVETQTEAEGWSVTVTRRILLNGDPDKVVDEREWVVRYAPKFAVYEVHPCKMPDATTTCPTTTTTSTTTTTVPTTTTTVPTTPPSSDGG